MEQTTAPKPFVFVLMPFDTAFNDTYQLGIKAACNDAGAYCERVDEQIFEDSILQRVYNQIAKADVLIADMTGRNPNVFYEVGYAHALGKHPILLTQKTDDIPFDLKHYPHIVYAGKITELKKELEKRVRWALENPKEFRGLAERRINVFGSSTFIMGRNTSARIFAERAAGSEVAWICRAPFPLTPALSLGARETRSPLGSHTRGWIGESCFRKLPRRPNVFLLPRGEGQDEGEGGALAKGRVLTFQPYASRLYPLRTSRNHKSFELLPGYWEKLKIVFHPGEGHKLNSIAHFVLRIYSEAGVQEYPFDLRLLPSPETLIRVGN